MSPPTLTAVIPCYNHGKFVAEAVASCLALEGAQVRVVVVDDGSDDGSTPGACDGCASDRVRVIHQPNMGLPAARNRGAEGATGEYLIFLDADDFLEPAFAKTLHEAIKADPNPGDVSHAYCQERLVGIHQGVWEVPEWDPMLMMVTNLHPVTALIRRDRFEAVGGFDESMNEGYEDWDLWLKFVERGWRGVRVREPLFNWRRHSEVTMITEAGARHERLFRRLVENHPDFYAEHAAELLVLSNAMLRKGEANWIDERLDAIVLRDTRRHLEDLLAERTDDNGRYERIKSERDGALRQRDEALAAARTAAEVAERIRAEYESKPVIRLSRAFHRMLDALPRPIGGPAKGVTRTIKKAAAPKRG